MLVLLDGNSRDYYRIHTLGTVERPNFTAIHSNQKCQRHGEAQAEVQVSPQSSIMPGPDLTAIHPKAVIFTPCEISRVTEGRPEDIWNNLAFRSSDWRFLGAGDDNNDIR